MGLKLLFSLIIRACDLYFWNLCPYIHYWWYQQSKLANTCLPLILTGNDLSPDFAGFCKKNQEIDSLETGVKKKIPGGILKFYESSIIEDSENPI